MSAPASFPVARTRQQAVIVSDIPLSNNLLLPAGSTQRGVVASGSLGPGRLLGKLYTVCGEAMGVGAGRLAHNMGYGPEAVAKSIWKRFEKPHERLEQIAALRDQEVDPKLEKKCLELMAYALP